MKKQKMGCLRSLFNSKAWLRVNTLSPKEKTRVKGYLSAGKLLSDALSIIEAHRFVHAKR